MCHIKSRDMVSDIIDVVSNKKLSVKNNPYRTVLIFSNTRMLFMSENQDIQNNPSPDLQINCIPQDRLVKSSRNINVYLKNSSGPMPTHRKKKEHQ